MASSSGSSVVGASLLQEVAQCPWILQRYMEADRKLNQQRKPPLSLQEVPVPSAERGSFCVSQEMCFPPSLIEEFQGTDISTVFDMGLLPEINRAYMIMDNRLFLWNYIDASSDVVHFEQSNEAIVTVGLVRPVPDVFSEDVHHLLVIATASEVSLVAIRLTDLSPNMSEIRLLPTEFTMPNDNILITKIVGTPSGRIFMAGKDGGLYELEYEVHPGWFRKKFRKVKRNKRFLQNLVPSFLKVFRDDSPIVDLCVDPASSILYVLNSKSSVAAYFFGKEGNGFHSLGSVRPSLDARDAICSIHVFRSPGMKANLYSAIGVTSRGGRVFFSVKPSGSTSFLDYEKSRTLKTLRPSVAHPEEYYADHDVQPAPCLVAPGAYLYARPLNASLDGIMQFEVTCSLPLDVPAENRKFSDNYLYFEAQSFINVPGRVYALAEIPPHVVFPYQYEQLQYLVASVPRSEADPRQSYFLENFLFHGGMNPFQTLSDSPTQHVLPPRQFVCLSSEGIFLLEKCRPIDTLSRVLATQSLPEGDHLREFTENRDLSRAEFCAMCLSLRCRLNPIPLPFVCPSYHGCASNTFSSQVTEPAEWAFLHFGDVPSSQSFTGRDRGVSVSVKVEALYLMLSRILAPVWVEPFMHVSGTGDEAIYRMVLQETSIQYTLDCLSNLHSFSGGIPPPTRYNATKSEQQEVREREVIQEFISRAMQVLSFLLVLKRLEDTFPVPEKLRLVVEMFKPVTMQSLFNWDAGTPIDILKKAIIEAAPLDHIGEELAARCSQLYNRADEAFLCIEEANKLSDRRRALELLDKSRRIYLEAEADFKLSEVRQLYTKAQYYRGFVDVALRFASRLDKDDVVFRKWRSRRNLSGFTHKEKLVVEQRFKCYDEVLGMLTDLKQSVENAGPAEKSRFEQEKKKLLLHCFACDDEMFHIFLYEWMLNDPEECHFLLEQKTPFLEKDLKFRFENTVSLEEKNLLWKYYRSMQRNDQAAAILQKLATEDLPEEMEVTFEHRLQYLTDALLCVRSCRGEGQRLMDLKDRLDVARIQEAVLKMLSSVESSSGRGQSREVKLLHRARKILLHPDQLSQLCSVFRSQFPKLRFYLLALCYNCNYFGEELEGIWEEIFAYAKNRSLSMDSFALDIQLFVQFAFPEGYMSDPYSGVPVVSSIGLTTREKVLAGLVEKLEKLSSERQEVFSWAAKLLVSCGLGIPQLYSRYRHLASLYQPSVDSSQLPDFARLCEAVVWLFSNWTDLPREFLEEEVEWFKKKCSQYLRGDRSAELNRLEQKFDNLLPRD